MYIKSADFYLQGWSKFIDANTITSLIFNFQGIKAKVALRKYIFIFAY